MVLQDPRCPTRCPCRGQTNHYRRDKTFAEDISRVCTGDGPANAAALNNLALALLLSQRPFETVPEAQIYYAGNRDEALQLLLALA